MAHAFSHFGFAALLATATATASSNSIDFGAPIGFVPNKGQVVDEHGRANPAVHYLFGGPGLNVQLRANGFAYEAWRTDEADATEKDGVYHIHRIDVELEGCNADAPWEESGGSADVLNYYSAITGENGITGVHHYQQVIRRGIYPFIDLVFRMDPNDPQQVKYDFVVHPGGNTSAIRMRFAGAQADLSTDQSAVTLRWAEGALHDRVPLSYWEGDGKRERAQVIPVRISADIFGYRLVSAPRADQRDLVIDPVPDLEWATYYGTDETGGLSSVTIDGSDNVIAAGTAGITGLASAGAHDVVLSGTKDALLVKFNAAGQRLWATYYGGSNVEQGSVTAHDTNGNIYLAGTTMSNSAIATPFVHQYTYTSGYSAYLVKFTPSGTRTWGTYFGHAQHQYVHGITVDGAGNPVIAGDAFGSGVATTGAADATYAGGGDAFIAKFTTSGQLSWATYLGGDYQDKVNALSCDGTFIFAAGQTNSPAGVATSGAHDVTLNTTDPDDWDGFLVKYSGLGQKLWGTYYGGNSHDRALGCAAELQTGNVYLTGVTASTGSVATLFQHQSALSGTQDGFLVKFNNNGLRQWGTYYGGTSTDDAVAVAIGDMSRVFIYGNTLSSNGIATSSAAFPTRAGDQDVYAAGFSSSGGRLWGTYFGGTGLEAAGDVAVSGLDFAIVGRTMSTSGIATPGAYQTSSGPLTNGTRFIARFSSPLFFMKNSTDEDAPAAPITMYSTGSVITVLLPAAMIGTASPITVHVVDLQGRTVLDRAEPVDGERMTIDAGGIVPGVYVVTLVIGDQRWSQRVPLSNQ